MLAPCCGTGAYLVETLSVIAATLAEQGEGATLAGRLKKAATDRVFGFEILPAPFSEYLYSAARAAIVRRGRRGS